MEDGRVRYRRIGVTVACWVGAGQCWVSQCRLAAEGRNCNRESGGEVRSNREIEEHRSQFGTGEHWLKPAQVGSRESEL